MGWIWRMNDQTNEWSYSEIRQLFIQQRVERFTVEDDWLILDLNEEVFGTDTIRYELYDVDYFYHDMNALVQEQS